MESLLEHKPFRSLPLCKTFISCFPSPFLAIHSLYEYSLTKLTEPKTIFEKVFSFLLNKGFSLRAS